jgi:type II secretory pathway component PulF
MKPKNAENFNSKKSQWSNVFTLGLAKEREYFVENLSMLISGGMPIIGALGAISQELRSRRMKNIIAVMKSDIESGYPLWKTLANTALFPEHSVSLIRLGEESGKLIENLKVVSVEQEKERVFKSKLHSAMMYPIFVLLLTVIIGIGIAWFILPKLATVFSQLKIKLPLITKILIGGGTFLGSYGMVVVPAAIIVAAVLFFFIFSFSKTKFIGQFLLFYIPGVNTLIKEVETARFGYLLGTLLEAGLPITRALDSLSSATEIAPYRKLYAHMRDSVADGNSVQKSFAAFPHTRRLVPAPIQQLIVAGEQSGTLSETLVKVGTMFETKADTTTKNLTVILEPILLVIVWLGVVGVALAVILPIYSLIGGFNSGSQTETQSAPVVEETMNTPPALPPDQEIFLNAEVPSDETTSEETVIEIIPEKQKTLRILPTGTGYLNARDKPSLQGEVVARVTPEEIIEYTNTENGWYEIMINCKLSNVKCFRDSETGWVFGKYVEIYKLTL